MSTVQLRNKDALNTCVQYLQKKLALLECLAGNKWNFSPSKFSRAYVDDKLLKYVAGGQGFESPTGACLFRNAMLKDGYG